MESLKDTLGALNREVVDEVGFEVGDIGCATLHLTLTLVQHPSLILNTTLSL